MSAPNTAPPVQEAPVRSAGEAAVGARRGGIMCLPGAVLDRLQREVRLVERQVARVAPARTLIALPRTARFAAKTVARKLGDPAPGMPVPDLSVGLLAQVAMDEAMLGIAMGPNRFPRRADYERVGTELAHARLLFERNGWLDDPASYHRAPPPLDDPEISTGWALGQDYERITFPSEYLPGEEEPGFDRWTGYHANHTASAAILRHPGGPRPWVIAIHGFGMGYPTTDLIGLHVLKLHRELGLNVALPVLPLHGHRRVTWFSGEAMLSFDLMNSVHGLAQAAWDIRQVISWVRAQQATSVGLYGVSLGGYLTALVAGLEEVDAAVAGVPVVDFPALFMSHSPAHIRLRGFEHAIFGDTVDLVHRVVSPLALAPKVPRSGRFIFAGTGDRLARPTQAHQLWQHWEEPSICWYPGNHVGYMWSGQVREFVLDSLSTSLH